MFREAQQFRQTWLWALIISGTLIPVVLVSVLLSQDKNVSLFETIGVIALVASISGINMVALYITKLETIVTDAGVYFRWRPYLRKYNMLPWEQIAMMTVKKYPYLKYGYSNNKDYGKVHNIDGKRGILFELVDGKRVFLGTQKLKALQYTLEQIKPLLVQTK
ncbi:hypothetical protein [Paraflavitalea speifideaquila]|uniref:hypothetical protein n=1 Tax=Paraflavitalea speifideaquila TaxID=3076558 RepID=UPI0028E4A80F|nr:hypothetical protein [Paraflavitalea speifideiaquila]